MSVKFYSSMFLNMYNDVDGMELQEAKRSLEEVNEFLDKIQSLQCEIENRITKLNEE